MMEMSRKHDSATSLTDSDATCNSEGQTLIEKQTLSEWNCENAGMEFPNEQRYDSKRWVQSQPSSMQTPNTEGMKINQQPEASSCDLQDHCGPTAEQLDEVDPCTPSHPEDNNGSESLKDTRQSTTRAFNPEHHQVSPKAQSEDPDQTPDLAWSLSQMQGNLTAATSQMQAILAVSAPQTSRVSIVTQQDEDTEDDVRLSNCSFKPPGQPRTPPVKKKIQVRKFCSTPNFGMSVHPRGAIQLPRRTSVPTTASMSADTRPYCNLCLSKIPSSTDPANCKWRYSIHNWLFVNTEEKMVHVIFYVKNKKSSQYLSQYSNNKCFHPWPHGKPKQLKACPRDIIHYHCKDTSDNCSLPINAEIAFNVSSFQHESHIQYDLPVEPDSSACGPILLCYRVHTSTFHELEIPLRIALGRNSVDARSAASSNLPLLSQPQDDTPDISQCNVINNQLFINENTLCIECVFWRGQSDFTTDFTMGIKLPQKPYILKVTTTGRICFRFTTKKDDQAYSVNNEEEHELLGSYFRDNCYKTYSFRVDSGFTKLHYGDINIDYVVDDGSSPRTIPLRIKSRRDVEQETSHKGGMHFTLNLSQGEWSNTIKNLVTGGLLKEKNERTESHFVSGKNK